MIVQTQTTSFKEQLYSGVHNLLSDSLYIALYDGNANLDQTTTIYSSTNEITGAGYTAGGQLITGVTVQSDNYTAYVSFTNPYWSPAAFTTRCALIYNATQGNKSIAVLDFGSDKTCTTTFTITLPANTSTAALIRSSN
jgi:hypothetical protein